MSAVVPVPVHGKSVLENMEPAKEINGANTASPKENVCIDVEPPKVKVPIQDVVLKRKRIDPAALLRQKTWKFISDLMDAAPWTYALSSAILFVIPLLQCIDVECMGFCLPPSVWNLWYTNGVVIMTLLCLDLLMAALLSVKSELVKIFFILKFTLLFIYYVLGFLLYIAIQPYDTHLALHVFGTNCAIVFPSLILSRAMTKKQKVQVVFVNGISHA